MFRKLLIAALPICLMTELSAQEITPFERLETMQQISKDLNSPGVLYGFVRFTSKECGICQQQVENFGPAIFHSIGYIANNERARFYTVNLDDQDELGRKMLASHGAPQAGDIRIYKDTISKETFSDTPDTFEAVTKAVETLVKQSEAPDADIAFVDFQTYKERHPKGFEGWTVFYTGEPDLRTDVVNYEIKSRSWSRSDKVTYVFVSDDDSAGLSHLTKAGVPTTKRHLTIYHGNAVVDQYDVADFKARAQFREKFDEFDIW